MRNTTGNLENTAPRIAGSRSVVFRTAAVLVFLTCFGSLASAQIPEGVNTAPPPIKRIPKDDSENLKKQTKPSNRTKLALQMMDARLVNAEAANGANELDKMFTELGVFHAIMEDTLKFLDDLHRRTGKNLDNFKRYEIGLRRFTPRLEMLRREMPLSHEFYVRSLLKQLRDARTKATEPLFGNSVIRDS